MTITPSGTVGSTVSGTLYLESLSSTDAGLTGNPDPAIAPGASDVAALPYTYSIGAPPKS